MSLQLLWPTPLGVHRYEQAADANPLLTRMLLALRATQRLARGEPERPFFASDDDLLQRLQLPEFQALVQWFVRCLRDTVTATNAAAWPAAWQQGGVDLQVAFSGMWYQTSQQGAFHDVHTHGNASWSGVYCLQVDDEASRCAHPVYGPANGVTRFYGPHFNALAGAHVDLGNAYLQPPSIDVAPLPGQLLLFPSHLAHQALPYAGQLERVIVSFNASVHRAGGSDRLHGFSG